MGTKQGRKFHDLDGDGEEDASEPGLYNWEIHLFAERTVNDTPFYVATTDVHGNFATPVVSGCYTVCEVLKTDWTQSFPNGAPVGKDVVDCTGYDGADYGPKGYYECIEANAVISDNVFGNYTTAIKKGLKFHDLNANGLKEDEEPVLPGWTINLEGVEGDGDVVADSTATNANGYYSFEVNPGTYTITEQCPLAEGWRQSTPGPRTDEAGCGDNAHVVTMESEDVDDDNHFGNFKDAVKSGMKFHDLDHSGGWTAGDEVMEGWTIYLDGTDGAGNTVHQETQTDENGMYSFTVPPGSYVVCEDLPGDWNQTFPAAGQGIVACPAEYGGGLGYEVELDSEGSHTDNDFGNDPKMIVGGASHPSNVLALLAPWLGLIAVGLLVMGTVTLWRRKAT
jgi:hypothetical protein